jgi:allantoate deiminase
METFLEVVSRCDILARFSEEPDRLTRTFLSEPMRPLHEQLGAWMRAAGMEVRIDAIGNLIGHYPGDEPEAPILLVGSHVDSVPDAGKYDGILGVLLGVALVQSWRGKRYPFAVEVIAFSEEEGIRYRTPYLGSAAVAGRFDPAWLERRDAAGISMAEAIRRFGLDPARIPEAAYRPEQLLGYLEVHIEQGPVLESWGLPVGVVEAIAGQSRYGFRFLGKAGHAGTLPMELRQDALAAAAEFVVAVEAAARARDGLRATVGALTVAPGAVNVVPGEVTLSLDVRHARDEVREEATAALLHHAASIASRRGVRFVIERAEHYPAVPADPRLTELLAAAVHAQGLPAQRMVSGAGHDAAVMATVAPMAMLFVRSPGGVSHHPDEAVLDADVGIALEVMQRFVSSLTRGLE